MRKIVVNNSIYLDTVTLLDALSLHTLANDPIFRQNMGDRFPYPYTEKDAREFITHCQEELIKVNGEKNYGIYIEGEYAGNLGYQQKKTGRELYNCHLGYWLGKKYWKKGYMSNIVKVIVQHIFDTTEVHRIYANVVSSNPGSRRVLEKNGFLLEGTGRETQFFNETRYDHWTLSLLRADYEKMT